MAADNGKQIAETRIVSLPLRLFEPPIENLTARAASTPDLDLATPMSQPSPFSHAQGEFLS
jgi:hypothetical protein